MDTDFTKVGERIKSWSGHVEKFVNQNKETLHRVDGVIKTVMHMAEEMIKEALASAQKKAAEPVVLKAQKLAHYKGDLPAYQSKSASGFDVRACLEQDVVLQPGQRYLVPTGLSFEIPEGYELQARPRSGLAIKQGIGLVNSPGTIDADYRGEVKIIIINLGQEPVTLKDQDRVAQLVLCPVLQAQLVAADELSVTERGAGGFGSTGAN